MASPTSCAPQTPWWPSPIKRPPRPPLPPPGLPLPVPPPEPGLPAPVPPLAPPPVHLSAPGPQRTEPQWLSRGWTSAAGSGAGPTRGRPLAGLGCGFCTYGSESGTSDSGPLSGSGSWRSVASPP